MSIEDMRRQMDVNAWGYGGQYIFVIPGLDLVIVTTSSTTPGDERRGHRRTVLDLVERLVIEPMAANDSPGAANLR